MEFIFISLIILAETAGQGFLKAYAIDLHPQFLGLGLACYVAVVVLLSKVLQFDGVGAINLMWSVMSVVAVFAVGMVFFNEHITTMQLTGVTLSLVGIAILHIA